MKYRIYAYCKDSQMDDFDCCNGAFDEINSEVFNTREEAEKEAEEFTRNVGPWDYEIIEIADNKVMGDEK